MSRWRAEAKIDKIDGDDDDEVLQRRVCWRMTVLERWENAEREYLV